MKTYFSGIKIRLSNNKLFKDSFWAVIGNGLGNLLLLIAGIVIARMLGKDLYGEYGMVKNTMFHVASFSTLGLGFTSTKYIADAISNSPNKLGRIIKTSLGTTFVFSFLLCLLLFVFAGTLANYINEPQSATVFRTLGFIVVLRAINTISTGILAGYKLFKTVGINSVISGVVLLAFASILTYKLGLVGSFIALSLSQLVNALFNFFAVVKQFKITIVNDDSSVSKEMLMFTVPVAIQEFTYMLGTWGGIMILTKYASLGEVGLWTAASQWYTIILFVPNLLLNVILSYLSGLSKDKSGHSRMIKQMLVISFVCSFVPFIIVYVLAGFISSFYGVTFTGLTEVIRVVTISTVLSCLSNVFHSSLLSEGRNWTLLTFRVFRDLFMIVSLWILLQNGIDHASLTYSWIYVTANIIYFLMMVISEISYKKTSKKEE